MKKMFNKKPLSYYNSCSLFRFNWFGTCFDFRMPVFLPNVEFYNRPGRIHTTIVVHKKLQDV